MENMKKSLTQAVENLDKQIGAMTKERDELKEVLLAISEHEHRKHAVPVAKPTEAKPCVGPECTVAPVPAVEPVAQTEVPAAEPTAPVEPVAAAPTAPVENKRPFSF